MPKETVHKLYTNGCNCLANMETNTYIDLKVYIIINIKFTIL